MTSNYTHNTYFSDIDEIHIRMKDCSLIMESLFYFLDLRALNPNIQSFVIDDCLKVQDYYQITTYNDDKTFVSTGLFATISITVAIMVRVLEKLACWYFKHQASKKLLDQATLSNTSTNQQSIQDNLSPHATVILPCNSNGCSNSSPPPHSTSTDN